MIGPAEVGLLATVGVMFVSCYVKPIVGILSTGSELVNPWETPVGSQIRDSNRATLLAAFKQDGYSCIDLGTFRVQMILAAFSILLTLHGTLSQYIFSLFLRGGIVRDSAEALEEVMLRAISKCNVVVTSGGVSIS